MLGMFVAILFTLLLEPPLANRYYHVLFRSGVSGRNDEFTYSSMSGVELIASDEQKVATEHSVGRFGNG